MRDLYIGGSRRAKKGGVMWKLYLFLFLFLVVSGAALKVSAPFIVEKWLNNHGSGTSGYAFSVRDVELNLRENKMTLKDVKVFNPKTNVQMIESPNLELEMDLRDVLIGSSSRKVNISGEKLDVFLSSDLTSEIERMKKNTEAQDLFFTLVEGKFSQLNFIEKKAHESRTLMNFNDVVLKIKEISTIAVNKKTEFSFSSRIAEGGELSLNGKMSEEEGRLSWKIQGSLKDFAPELFNKLAGTQLPFTFNEPTLNAKITANSKEGKLTGEILPEVTRLNLIVERVGFEKQVIARALTDDLTFSLPFMLKDELTVEYAQTYKKLREYRKYPSISAYFK